MRIRRKAHSNLASRDKTSGIIVLYLFPTIEIGIIEITKPFFRLISRYTENKNGMEHSIGIQSNPRNIFPGKDRFRCKVLASTNSSIY